MLHKPVSMRLQARQQLCWIASLEKTMAGMSGVCVHCGASRHTPLYHSRSAQLWLQLEATRGSQG